jgi:transglutaminase-like putative cysteine protease
MAATGLLIIYYSGEVPDMGWIFTITGIIASIVIRPDFRRKSVTFLWNSVVITALIYLLFRGIYEGNYLLMAIYFSIIMLISKLFQRRNALDYYQIYALSFLHVVGGAVINPGISFGILFIIYVILITWCLIFVHTRRETELRSAENTLHEGFFIQGKESSELSGRDLISRQLLAGTSALALIIFFFSMIFFFIFPRLGMGFFSMKTRKSTQIAGFSDHIELGSFGTIKDDPEVLRGISLDFYDGASGWRKTLLRKREMGFSIDGMKILPYTKTNVSRSRFSSSEIYLEPMDTDIRPVFGIPRIMGVSQVGGSLDFIKKERFRFYFDESMDLSIIGPAEASIAYEIFTSPENLSPEDENNLREFKFNPEKNPWIADYYLQLPQIDSRIREFAVSITKDKGNAYDIAHSIEKYLREEFTYSTDIQQFQGDPLAFFLFSSRSGHCEYFATAMAVLLRTVNVPARVVNGFYGGEWNEYGQYYAVKKGNAHSWTEVYFGKYGWITFDPTPPSALISLTSASFFNTVNKYMDYLKLRWYRWVIEYDMEKQIAALQSFFSAFEGKGESGIDIKPLELRDIMKLQKDLKSLPFNKILLIILCIIVSAALLRLICIKLKRRILLRERRAGKSEEIIVIYNSMLKILQKKGYRKKPSLTVLEFCSMLRNASFENMQPVEFITEIYNRTLFSGMQANPDEIRHSRDSLKSLKKA